MTQQKQQQQQQYVTRTRQDLINSGDLFRMNEKFAKEEQERNLKWHQLSSSKKDGGGSGRLLECCYSSCNLTLIVAAVITLALLIRFLYDEPLYEYGEYILGLAFYRQLIYVMAIVPFILLLPIFNATSVLCSSRPSRRNANTVALQQQQQQQESQSAQSAPSATLLKLKLVYQFVMLALVLLALIFVCPYIRASTVASYIEIEFRRHLGRRYDSDFSYQLLDRIQEQYECCDHMWYRANLDDKVPISCFVPGSQFGLVYTDTCPDAVGLRVATRCAIIAACLFVIFLALLCLVAIDAVALSTRGRRRGARRGEYEITPSMPPPLVLSNGAANGKNARESNEAARSSDAIHEQLLKSNSGQGAPRANQEEDDEDEEENSEDSAAAERQLRELVAEREVPLLQKASSFGRRQDDEDSWLQGDDDDDDELNSRKQTTWTKLEPEDRDSPILLTRADYKTIARQRSQSPVFLSTTTTTTSAGGDNSNSKADQQQVRSPLPIKSALKTSSPTHLSITPERPSNQPRESYRRLSPEETPSGGGGYERESYSRKVYRKEEVEEVDIRGGNNDDNDVDDESLVSDYAERLRKSDSLLRQKQLLRRDQLRKSLQSVRFADDNP